jgi:predicted alpha/beta superfamily hydrolase
MKVVFGIVFITFFVCRLTLSQEMRPTSANIETQTLTSKVFNNTRTIRVLLPPGYHDEKNRRKSYPVLYLNDGTMVFRALKIEETVHRLINTGVISPLIVVGIDNGGSTDKTKNAASDRTNEFLPYPDVGFPPDNLYEPDPPNPVGKMYPDFVAEVMALIKEKYRVEPGAENTGIGGFSYGGVAALYAASNKPDIFGRLLLESTPLWIGKDRQLLKDIQQTKKWAAKIYIGLGTNESPDEAVNKEGRTDHDVLLGSIRKNSPETNLNFVLGEGDKHEPSAWGKRFPAALQILFGTKTSQRPSALNTETIKLAPGGAATIDGKIEDAEWRDASVFDLTGGGRVFFKTDGSHLFVGVRGLKKGWSHLYLSRGDRADVSVMHASAALGMTVYSQNKNNLWQPVNPFAWDLRDRAVTAETKQKMTEYLAKNFWAANNNNMTDLPEIEFQVKPRNAADKTLYVAVVYAADAKNPQYFPASLKDDTIKEELIYGNTPNDLKFDRNGWAKIVLEDKKAPAAK